MPGHDFQVKQDLVVTHRFSSQIVCKQPKTAREFYKTTCRKALFAINNFYDENIPKRRSILSTNYVIAANDYNYATALAKIVFLKLRFFSFW
jgi:hypothetical protein